MLRRYQNAEGIVSYQVAVGENITMTPAEVAAGLMRVAVSFVPTSLVESIEFNVTIQETDSIYDVQISGGVL